LQDYSGATKLGLLGVGLYSNMSKGFLLFHLHDLLKPVIISFDAFISILVHIHFGSKAQNVLLIHLKNIDDIVTLECKNNRVIYRIFIYKPDIR